MTTQNIQENSKCPQSHGAKGVLQACLLLCVLKCYSFWTFSLMQTEIFGIFAQRKQFLLHKHF